MKQYKVISVIELFSGVIGLSDKQAGLREKKLKKVGKGRYEILQPVQFKAGEIVSFDKPPKPYLPVLEKLAADSKEQASNGATELPGGA
jgi:hypothetical protein